MRNFFHGFIFLAFVLLSFTGYSQDKSVEMKPLEVKDASHYTALLQDGLTFHKNGKYYQAIGKFDEILRTGAETEKYYDEALYSMGLSLYYLRYYQSAMQYFGKILEKGASGHRYIDVLKWLLLIQREIPGDLAILEKISSYPVSAFPKEYENELKFLVGQFYYIQGNLDKSLQLLQLVQTGSVFYLRAKYLEGVLWVRKNEAKNAGEAFKDVLRFIRDSKSSDKEYKKYKEMTLLALARIFYSLQQLRTAIRYYDQISMESNFWLDALFESSWAYYRIHDQPSFEKAMGNLHTLNSPYFEEEYFPESRVLQAVILFANCNYEEAIAIVEKFYNDYETLRKALKAELDKHKDPNEFYQYLAKLSRVQNVKEFSIQLKQIVNAALSDNRVYRLFNLIVQLNSEMKSIEEKTDYFPNKQVAKDLVNNLIVYRELVIGDAGTLARARLERVFKELTSLISQGLKIKFETYNALKELYRKKGTNPEQVEVKVKSVSYKVDSEHMYWPFEGEYWKDELGSYIYEIDNRCEVTEKPKEKLKEVPKKQEPNKEDAL